MLATDKHSLKDNVYIDIFFLLLLLGIFYALFMGAYPFFSPDEGRYSEVAREMIVSGDYITPRVDGVAFLDKPALYYWLQASAIKCFGIKEWALRFWPCLLGIITCLLTYVAGRFLWNRACGIIAALILATSPLYYGAAHYANLDLEVACFISNALLCYLMASNASTVTVRRWLLLAAYCFTGLAILTKGLIGIVFPALIIGSWIAITQKWYLLRQMHVFIGLGICLAISAPWYILVQNANPEFAHFFFVTQQVSRFLTAENFNNKITVWFYLPVVFLGFFPWSIFLLQGCLASLQKFYRKTSEDTSLLFLLLWVMIVVLFFSIPASKTVGYILPVFPAMALLVGNYLSQFTKQHSAACKENSVNEGFQENVPLAQSSNLQKQRTLPRWPLALYGSLCCIIAALLWLAPYIKLKKIIILPSMLTNLHTMAVLFLCSGIGALFVRKKFIHIFIFLLLSTTSLLVTFTASLATFNHSSIKPLALALKTRLQPGDEVVTFYKYYQDLPLYLEKTVTIVANWHASDIVRKDNWLRELWYGMAFQNTQTWLIDETTFWHRWQHAHKIYVLTNTHYAAYIIKHSPLAHKLAQHEDTVLLSNA